MGRQELAMEGVEGEDVEMRGFHNPLFSSTVAAAPKDKRCAGRISGIIFLLCRILFLTPVAGASPSLLKQERCLMNFWWAPDVGCERGPASHAGRCTLYP